MKRPGNAVIKPNYQFYNLNIISVPFRGNFLSTPLVKIIELSRV